ncbi:hypothetical protein XA68_14376 [Ophiocordyceps unilateralis]|uniref:Ecp2 effector protein domain-containing protein n=1 Tax=Ophiocordyceps unilateralis TaxID=268505 RepID=A0A2A9PL72_OPHUN|nr:hypothetical protein XA68_14376 [Ophiocordyceps unilateralis]
MRPGLFLAALLPMVTQASPATSGLKLRVGPLQGEATDGTYEGSSADRSTKWSHLGVDQPQRRQVDETASGNFYFCVGDHVDGDDAHKAIEGFIRECDTGRHFKTMLAHAHGTAIAYGCSLKGGHTCATGPYNASAFLRGLKGACGAEKSGFFSLPNEKLFYGLAQIGSIVC